MNENKPQVPYIWCHSNIGIDGTEYITVTLEEPEIDGRDLYNGGRMVHFDIDNKKQTTAAIYYTWHHGAPRFETEYFRRWKDEVLAESECLAFCKFIEPRSRRGLRSRSGRQS